MYFFSSDSEKTGITSDDDSIWKMIVKKTNGIKRLTCHRCGHKWNYKGTDRYRASCPRCRTSVIISKKRVRKK